MNADDDEDFEVIEVVDLRTPSASPTPGPSISSASAQLAQSAQTHTSTHPRAQPIVTSALAISVPPTRAQGYAAALSPDSTPASTPVRALPRFSSHKDDQDDVIDMVDMVAIEAQAQVDAGTASSKTAGGALGKAKRALGEKPSPAGLAYIRSLITPQSQKSMAELVRNAGKQRKRKRSKKDKTVKPTESAKAVSRQGDGAKAQKEKQSQGAADPRSMMQDDGMIRANRKGKKRVKMAKEVTEIRNPADWADSRESTFDSDVEATAAFKSAIPPRQAALDPIQPVDRQAAPAFIARLASKKAHAQPAGAPLPPSPAALELASILRIPAIQVKAAQINGRVGQFASSKFAPSVAPSLGPRPRTAATVQVDPRARPLSLPKPADIARKTRNTSPMTAVRKQTGVRPPTAPPAPPSASKPPLVTISKPKVLSLPLKASATSTGEPYKPPTVREKPIHIKGAKPPVTPPPSSATSPAAYLSPIPSPVVLANKKPRSHPLPPAPSPLSPLSPDLVRTQYQTPPPPPSFTSSKPSSFSSSPSSGSIASTSTLSTSSGHVKSKRPDRVPTWVYMTSSRSRPIVKLPPTPPVTPENALVATSIAVQHRSPLAPKGADANDSVNEVGGLESAADDEMSVDLSASDEEMKQDIGGSIGGHGMEGAVHGADMADGDDTDEVDWGREGSEGNGLEYDDELEDGDGLIDDDQMDEGDHTDCGDEMREGHGLKGECELDGCGDHGLDGGREDSSDTETGVDGHRHSHLRARDYRESEGDLEYDASNEIRAGREEAEEMDGADWDAHGGSEMGDDEGREEGSDEGTEDDVEAVMDLDGEGEVYMRHENVHKGDYNDEYSDDRYDRDDSTDSEDSNRDTDESDMTHISETDYEDDDLGQNVYELLDTLRSTQDSSSFALH